MESIEETIILILNPTKHYEYVQVLFGPLQMEAGSQQLVLRRDELCLQYLLALESFSVYQKKLNVLNYEYDTK